MATIEERRGRGGKKVFRVKVRLRGQGEESATFNRLTDAKHWAAKIEDAIRESRYFPRREGAKHSLSEAIDRYKRDILPRKSYSTSLTQLGQLEWWRGALGNKAIGSVSSADISTCRDQLIQEGKSASTIIRYIAVISHLFSIAEKEWQWIKDNPVRAVTKPREPEGRLRYLSDEELSRLLNACTTSWNPQLRSLVLVALCTGMRKGELLNLQWSQVDLKSKVVVLTETKNKTRRHIPLVTPAYNVFLELWKKRSDADQSSLFVFPRPDGRGPVDIKRPWYDAVKRAKLRDFRFHDLRHSAASFMVMSGATLLDVATVLGHKTLQMSKRYSHLTQEHISGVLERTVTKFNLK